MRAKSGNAEQTVTEQARRAQIVTAAIDTIFELGTAGASFSQIAKRAGLSSTGLISYHFAGRQDLMDAVTTTVLGQFAEFVVAWPNDGTAAGTLRSFLSANIAFMRDHRKHLVAVLHIQNSGSHAGTEAQPSAADRDKLATLLRGGQSAGEFRDFDCDLMAGFIMSLRNGVLMRLATEPDFDLDACATELLDTVTAATRP